MLISLLIWTLIGIMLQLISGVYFGYLQAKVDDEVWNLGVETLEGLCYINPFAKMFVMEKGKTRGEITFKTVALAVLSNVTGWILWPVYIPIMLKYETKRFRQIANSKEGS